MIDHYKIEGWPNYRFQKFRFLNSSGKFRTRILSFINWPKFGSRWVFKNNVFRVPKFQVPGYKQGSSPGKRVDFLRIFRVEFLTFWFPSCLLRITFWSGFARKMDFTQVGKSRSATTDFDAVRTWYYSSRQFRGKVDGPTENELWKL